MPKVFAITLPDEVVNSLKKSLPKHQTGELTKVILDYITLGLIIDAIDGPSLIINGRPFVWHNENLFAQHNSEEGDAKVP